MKKYSLFIEILTILVIVIAIFIRIAAFFTRIYDLSPDECHSISLLRVNITDALKDFWQGANFLPGYKLLLKAIYSVFQFNYAAFKFPSLIAGILSVFMFKSLAFKVLKNKILALISLSLFAFNFTIIYYSNIIKPYEFDILFSLFIINIFITIEETGINEFLNKKIKYLYAFIISIILWSSTPAIVVFALCFITLFINNVIQQNKEAIINLTKVAPLFLIVLAIEYFVYINQMIGDMSLKDMWLSNEFFFMPKSLDAVNAIINFSFINFSWWDYNVDFHFSKFLIITLISLFFIGTFVFLKKNNFKQGVYVCFPIYIFILLSFLKIYPFTNRCITFLIPFFIIVLLKSFDININKPIKIVLTFIALICCSIYFYFIMVKHHYILDSLKQDEAYVIMRKTHFYNFENLKNDEVLISIKGNPCYSCFNNPNVVYFSWENISDFNIKIQDKKIIYLTLDSIEDITKYQDYIQSKGYKLVDKFDLISDISYLKFEK